jgi:hypothetical protein
MASVVRQDVRQHFLGGVEAGRHTHAAALGNLPAVVVELFNVIVGHGGTGDSQRIWTTGYRSVEPQFSEKNVQEGGRGDIRDARIRGHEDAGRLRTRRGEDGRRDQAIRRGGA